MMIMAIEIICMLIIAAKSGVYQATYIDIFTFLHLHQSMINHYQFKCMHRVSFLGVNQKKILLMHFLELSLYMKQHLTINVTLPEFCKLRLANQN